MNGQYQYLVLPVGHNYEIPLNQVLLEHEKEKSILKITKTIQYTYAKEKYFKQEWDGFYHSFAKTIVSHQKLVDINIGLIEYFLYILDLDDIEILKSSSVLDTAISNPTERFCIICKEEDITSIVTGNGSSIDKHDFHSLRNFGVSAYVQDFIGGFNSLKGKYTQINPTLSIVDALFKIGRDSIKQLLLEDVFVPEMIKYETN